MKFFNVGERTIQVIRDDTLIWTAFASFEKDIISAEIRSLALSAKRLWILSNVMLVTGKYDLCASFIRPAGQTHESRGQDAFPCNVISVLQRALKI